MSDDAATTFCAITGVSDITQASMYLEMAGGNLETAMSIFFDGGGGVAPSSSSSDADAANTPPWFHVIWPSTVTAFENIPEAWSMQNLEFDDIKKPGSGAGSIRIGIGLKQPMNGPCGVLAAIQAACIAEICCRSERTNTATASNQDEMQIDDSILTSVLTSMLWQAKSSSDVKLVTKAASPTNGGVDITTFTDRNTLENTISQSIGIFKDSVVLFMYSLVATRGDKNVKMDVLKSGGDLPLITSSLFLCSSDLVSLCLIGRANGNVGAYDNGENSKLDWPEGLGVGLLSMNEYVTKIPIADALKSPRYPVWIMHGGDHFTTMWTEKRTIPKIEGSGSSFSLLQWNGLPPNGPRLARLTITTKEQSAPAPKKRNTPVQFEPCIGEVESIVQADPIMKKTMPNSWTRWRYEVQLAGEQTKEEGTKYDPRPEGSLRPKTFDLKDYAPSGEEVRHWRCAACYSTRFKTMCFGMNNLKEHEKDPKCDNCGKNRSISGHTIWLTYDELPKSWKESADRQFAPKIVSVLRTKWPGCKVLNDFSQWPSI